MCDLSIGGEGPFEEEEKTAFKRETWSGIFGPVRDIVVNQNKVLLSHLDQKLTNCCELNWIVVNCFLQMILYACWQI
jgi:hypothetical protein